MTDATQTSASVEPERKPLTKEEVDALYADLGRRGKIQSNRAEAAVKPWADFLKAANADHKQVWRIEACVRKALETVDYFANKPVVVEVKLDKAFGARKGSPRNVICGSLDIKVEGQECAGAYGFFIIGKRGKVKGSIHERGMFSRDIDLGRKA